MMISKPKSYEIKLSKSENKVPVVNDIHLHSVYNPVKEAKNFIDKNIDILKSKSSILFLGLGFGYHVNEALTRMEELHKNFKIVVIEPNSQIIEDCLNFKLIDQKKVDIYGGIEIQKLYLDKVFVDFLVKGPGVIAHPGSFNLYKDYFKSFLTYKSDNRLEIIKEVIKDRNLKDYLEGFPQDIDLESALKRFIRPKKSIDSDLDFLLLTYGSLIKKQKNYSVEDISNA